MAQAPTLMRALLLALPLLGLTPASVLAQGSPASQAAPEGQGLAGDLAGDAAVARLLEVLRDDEARAALVAALEARGADNPDGTADAAGRDVALDVAALTLDLAGTLRGAAARLWSQVAALPVLVTGLPPIGPGERRVGLALLATILSTVAASLAAGRVASAVAARLRPGPGAGAARRWSRGLLALLAHLAAVLLAWLAGTALAVLLFSEEGRPWTSQLLYLNAFLAFGIARVALRGAANPEARREAALSRLDPELQRRIHASLRPVAGILAQGFLFVAPLVQLWAGFAAARPARLLVATAAALAALLAIARIRRALAGAPVPPAPAPLPDPASPAARAEPPQGLIGPPAPGAVAMPLPAGDPVADPPQAPAAMARGLGSAWASLWPPLAVLAVLYAWFVAATQPALAAAIVLRGTALTALGLALGAGALQLLRRAGALRMPLPPAARRALPTLQPRADRILAGLGAALALLVLAAAPLLALLGWAAADAWRLLDQPLPRRVAGQAASAALVVLGAAALWAAVASWIDARLARSEAIAEAGRKPDSQRARTLLALFRNAFTVAVATVAGMVALSQLGLDIAPLLAGAGVVGLAVGFGAQTLVKDIITGVFIQLEGAIDVGDVVGVAGITGGVERITIRSVRLRTMDGATHVIPFSSVTTVTNLTRDFGYHVADLVVGYAQSVPAVRAAMEEAFARLQGDPLAAEVDGGLDMQGVAELRADAVLVRARIRTRPGRQWDVGRRFSEILKGVLDERGIEVAAPARTMIVPAAPSARPA